MVGNHWTTLEVVSTDSSLKNKYNNSRCNKDNTFHHTVNNNIHFSYYLTALKQKPGVCKPHIDISAKPK